MFGGSRAPPAALRAQPFLRFAAFAQIFAQHGSVADEDVGVARLRRGALELSGGDGALGGGEDHIERTVRLQNGVLDRREVGNALAAQLLGQLIHGKPAAVHLLLVDRAFLNEKARLPEERRAQLLAAERDAGENEFKTEKRQNGNKAVHQRNADILQRERRQIRHQHGNDQLRELQLAELPLSQNAHAQKQQ